MIRPTLHGSRVPKLASLTKFQVSAPLVHRTLTALVCSGSAQQILIVHAGDTLEACWCTAMNRLNSAMLTAYHRVQHTPAGSIIRILPLEECIAPIGGCTLSNAVKIFCNLQSRWTFRTRSLPAQVSKAAEVRSRSSQRTGQYKYEQSTPDCYTHHACSSSIKCAPRPHTLTDRVCVPGWKHDCRTLWDQWTAATEGVSA